METLVLDLTIPQSRENALLELSKKRESFPELAPYLWHSFGTISALLQMRLPFTPPPPRVLMQSSLLVVCRLQEIVSIYPLLTPPALTAHASNRVCNALALLQCVASHQETRSLFLQGAAHICCLHLALCPALRHQDISSQRCLNPSRSICCKTTGYVIFHQCLFR
jgi:CCR4-NOT transcription complex subunit 9